MSNVIGFYLAIAIMLAAGCDIVLNESTVILFLAYQLVVFIEVIAFWR